MSILIFFIILAVQACAVLWVAMPRAMEVKTVRDLVVMTIPTALVAVLSTVGTTVIFEAIYKMCGS